MSIEYNHTVFCKHLFICIHLNKLNDITKMFGNFCIILNCEFTSTYNETSKIIEFLVDCLLLVVAALNSA